MNVVEFAPVQAILPCGTPSSAHVQVVPSLAQSSPNTVVVVPPLGLIEAEHIGAPLPSTSTLLEEQVWAPPGPTAVNVTA